MIVTEGNDMTRSLRAAVWSLAPLLILAGCAAESPEPPDTTVAAPTLSPEPGTYSADMDIVLATTTPGASIRYTTDGSTPTATTGTLYAAPVHVAETLTLKAVAYRTGWTTSSVTSGQYTIMPLVSAPAFAPGPGSYFAAQDVAITTATLGASIRYTTDGSTPTATTGTLYAGPVAVAETLVLRAAAFQAGWTTSPVTTGQYVIGPAVTAPVFTPGPGSYAGPQDIVLSTLTAGASIRYTTDGSDPTETTGTLYTGPVRLGTSATLKAVAYLAGWTPSPVTAGDYTISTLVAAPVFDPPAGTYDSARDVAITTSTSGATIRYTVDGTTPTESVGTVYTAPVHVADTPDAQGLGLPLGLDDLVGDLGPLHDRAARAGLQAVCLRRECRVADHLRVHDRSRGGDARRDHGLPLRGRRDVSLVPGRPPLRQVPLCPELCVPGHLDPDHRRRHGRARGDARFPLSDRRGLSGRGSRSSPRASTSTWPIRPPTASRVSPSTRPPGR